MSTIVTERGFAPDDWTAPILALDALLAGAEPGDAPLAVDLGNDVDPATLAPWLDRLALIRVAFPSFSDGRGLSMARRLRDLGYGGRLRAAGPLIADQLRAALRVGFDEIELPDAMAARQPEAVWRPRPQGSYQDRLMS
jgi:uncharacterized protein (DUF934 family)